MKNVMIVSGLIAVWLLQACTPAAPSPTATPIPSETPTATVPVQTETPPIEETATPGIVPPPVSSPSETMVQMSINDLHEKFNIAAEAVTVSEVTPMSWPDASLGCPKKGVLYIQAVTPGFQILLEADGHVFTFHTNQDRIVTLCSVEPPDEIYQVP